MSNEFQTRKILRDDGSRINIVVHIPHELCEGEELYRG
jgi:hypothetical protein